MSRRISAEAVLELAAALVLVRELAMPLPRAIPLAARAVAEPDRAEIRAGELLGLVIDMSALRRHVSGRLRLAAEVLPPSRRGRPPGRSAYA